MLRLDVSFPSGTLSLLPDENLVSAAISLKNHRKPSGICNNLLKYHWLTVFQSNSDGIARVHGMTNVQAEELVEYGYPHYLFYL